MTPDEKRKRIHDITYSTADRAELAERMVALENFAVHVYTCMEHYLGDNTFDCDNCPLDNDVQMCDLETRMEDLGLEVKS